MANGVLPRKVLMVGIHYSSLCATEAKSHRHLEYTDGISIVLIRTHWHQYSKSTHRGNDSKPSLAVLLGSVHKEVDNALGVTPLVIVPADELDELLVERDSGLGVEN